ncbi:M28 family peptidase [Neolewinella lacunae]|uniref:M28 family peptidase n=1 Tax=Neolewinella lacunae TaxID=1517758 RepID=UPI001FE282FA|nr:M28 family peptidase [Neolewinella lacunae]
MFLRFPFPLSGAFLLLLLLSACGADVPDAGTTEPAAAPVPRPEAKPVPRFVADSAYAYVAAQVAFGPRVMNTAAHDAAGAWLINKLESFGAEVTRQDFTATAYDGTTLKSFNIIARYNPDLTDRVLLAAHWDTRHVADSPLETDPGAVVEGADDGGSGVGVLLEIARQLGASTPYIGVDIVLFDAEDYGDSGQLDSWGLGAQYYSRNLPPNRPRYGILLDMVGAKDARFAQELVSLNSAPQIVDKVWNLAERMNYGTYFPKIQGKGVTDDHYFVNTIARIPMIDIINYRADTETGFVAHWHTGDDGLDVIDRNTLQAVGQVVLAVVYREAAGTL